MKSGRMNKRKGNSCAVMTFGTQCPKNWRSMSKKQIGTYLPTYIEFILVLD